MKHALAIAVIVGSTGWLGCVEHRVKTDPIYIKADINLNVRIDRELDEFFDYEDDLEPVAPDSGATDAPKEEPQP